MTSKELISFTCPNNTELAGMGGVANGYVAVPWSHPIYRMDYDRIYEHFHISVHGGLTFADYAEFLLNKSKEIPHNWWVVGFDTMHSSDLTGFMPGINKYVHEMRGHEADRWQKLSEVELEALTLKWQLEEIDTNWNRIKFGWLKSPLKANVSTTIDKLKNFLKLS